MDGLRLDLARFADMVLAFQDWIMKQNQHSDLIALYGVYANLFQQQMGINPHEPLPDEMGSGSGEMAWASRCSEGMEA